MEISSSRKNVFLNLQCNADNLLNLFNAVNALKEIDWFRESVRDIRGYRVEEWSDFTEIVKNKK